MRVMFRTLTAVAMALPGVASAQATGPGPADTLRVEFVEVAETSLVFDAALTGTVEAVDSVDLGFRLGGRVTEVLVQEGDRVGVGEALARTDPLQQEQALRTAEAALAAANATREQAAQANDRAVAMLTRGVGTRAARDQAEQALSQADGAVSQAQTALDQAQRALDDTVLRAPLDAVVTARNADPGQIVGAAQPVLSLAALGGLEAVFHTPDDPGLRDAQGVQVTLRTLDIDAPDMTARVTEISPLVDPRTGSVTLRARIENPPDSANLLGAAVRGTIHFAAGRGIELPWTALTRLCEDPAVWVIDDNGKVDLTPVEIARFSDRSVVIARGLSPGQKVVGAGSQMLYPGRSVQPGQIPE